MPPPQSNLRGMDVAVGAMTFWHICVKLVDGEFCNNAIFGQIGTKFLQNSKGLAMKFNICGDEFALYIMHKSMTLRTYDHIHLFAVARG